VRVVFVGAGSLSTSAAQVLLARGHEVVVVERDRARIEELAGGLECAFVHGDATRPAILREVDPRHTDHLFCLTDSDQTNLIASLVGRSLGFRNVVTGIREEDFEHICIELGLTQTVVPTRTIGRYLADVAEGHDVVELSTAIKGDARVFMLVAREQDALPISELELPDAARVSHLYRDGSLLIPDADTKLRRGDEVVVITHRKHLEALRERWAPPEPEAGEGR
jgi:trk system potassium uptake protein TrkA